MSSTAPDYQWLWYDDHDKVTTWFESLNDRHEYRLFYPSFINTAKRYWEISVNQTATAKKIEPLGQRIVNCLHEDPIPADMLIEALSAYQKFIGGTKASLKRVGPVRFGDDPPGKFLGV